MLKSSTADFFNSGEAPEHHADNAPRVGGGDVFGKYDASRIADRQSSADRKLLCRLPFFRCRGLYA